jgi:hypothetical protein
MQPLTADQLTILTSPAVEVAAGCDLLNADLSFREDISDDLAGGQVAWTLHATVHRTVRLELTRPLRWGVDLVRPHMTVLDRMSGLSSRWNVGVFALTTPERTVGETPESYDVSGYDRLHLLQRQVGVDYSIAAGVTYRQALLDTFVAAGLSGVLIDGAAAENTLPVGRSWPLVAVTTDPDQTSTPVTWLRVVNDLQREWNGRGVYADENGRYRCEAYQDPTIRAPEHTFDADSPVTIVGEDRTLSEDVWGTPNRWVFRQSNRANTAPAPTEGDGIYTVVNQSDGPTSIDSRGLTWTSVVDFEAASQPVLVALGNRKVAADRHLTSRLKVTTGPWPCAGHGDVYAYSDLALGADRKVQAVRWGFDLSGSDVEWEWEVV